MGRRDGWGEVAIKKERRKEKQEGEEEQPQVWGGGLSIPTHLWCALVFFPKNKGFKSAGEPLGWLSPSLRDLMACPVPGGELARVCLGGRPPATGTGLGKLLWPYYVI